MWGRVSRLYSVLSDYIQAKNRLPPKGLRQATRLEQNESGRLLHAHASDSGSRGSVERLGSLPPRVSVTRWEKESSPVIHSTFTNARPFAPKHHYGMNQNMIKYMTRRLQRCVPQGRAAEQGATRSGTLNPRVHNPGELSSRAVRFRKHRNICGCTGVL